MSVKNLDDVVDDHALELLSIPGVLGVAHGILGEMDCIKIYVSDKTDALMKQIPSVIEGYHTVVEVTGELKALNQK